MEFFWSDWCIRAISAGAGFTILFDGGLFFGDVVGDGDVDINESSDRNVGGCASWSRTDIVFEMACLG